MLGKFSKKELSFVNDERESIRAAVDALSEILSEEDVLVSTQGEFDLRLATIRVAYEKISQQIESVSSFMTTIAEDQQSEYDEKSERWQEGDRGGQVASWLEEVASLGGYEIDPFSVDASELMYRAGSLEDDFVIGVPTTFPVTVSLGYAISIDSLTGFVDSLEGLPESANEM